MNIGWTRDLPSECSGLNYIYSIGEAFIKKIDVKTLPISSSTGNDVYSGNHYCGNDRYSGLNPPDDAILFTVSGITAIADKKLEILIKNRYFETIFTMVIDAELSKSREYDCKLYHNQLLSK